MDLAFESISSGNESNERLKGIIRDIDGGVSPARSASKVSKRTKVSLVTTSLSRM
ncbi:MAG: hypothetical protein LJE75_07315 [Gammaproteobacteria bacterium]|jgi:hypothetical protein|nr:hypothetical protein [Gammaproteobacteria bacterium]